jgi:hypothetical protein
LKGLTGLSGPGPSIVIRLLLGFFLFFLSTIGLPPGGKIRPGNTASEKNFKAKIIRSDRKRD